MRPEPCELLVVGAGPAGLAAAFAARRCGLPCVVLECEYPVKRPLHSPPQDVELAWGELYAGRPPNVSREEILRHYYCFAAEQGLKIRQRESVQRIERDGEGFFVRSSRRDYRAQKVLIATGGFGLTRRLNVPGETSSRVAHRFVDGAPFAGREVLVAGGGNSAAEAALWLYQAKAKVTLSLRRPSFAPRHGATDAYTSVKPFNAAPLLALAERGEVKILFSSQVVEITPQTAILEHDGKRLEIVSSKIFALLGADPDVGLLRQAGAAIAADGRPVYDPGTYETTVPGLYVAGHLTRELHIPKALAITPKIVHRMAGARPSAEGASVGLDALARVAKALRRRSELVRLLIREYPLLRRPVQMADAANLMRDRRLSLAWRLASRYPLVLSVIRSIRAYAS